MTSALIGDHVDMKPPQNVIQANLTPIIGNIGTSVTGAVTELNLFVGQPLAVILASVDSFTILAASEIAVIIT
ncbi:hypothetical protein BS17DRAFT_789963 [Gyrodon lividus]|nr:hypothetical protein BS17DRAFT_789963 [Gyrodon lividus]